MLLTYMTSCIGYSQCPFTNTAVTLLQLDQRAQYSTNSDT